MTRRPGGLLLRIYAVSLAQLLAIAGSVVLVAWLTFSPQPRGGFMNEARYAAANLAAAGPAPSALARELARIRRFTGARASVYDVHGTLLASSAEPPLRPAQPDAGRPGPRLPLVRLGPPPPVTLPLSPEEPRRGYVVFRAGPPPPAPGLRAMWVLGIGALGAGLASALLARSLARPLGALAAAARALGQGDLTARVRMARRDELGELARTFDDMAERLAQLVRAQQELLANVSHELRTPLARIRVALDIAAEGDAEVAREALPEIAEDLAELERLVADVLQTARLDLASGQAGAHLPMRQVDTLEVGELLEEATRRFRAAHPERELRLSRAPGLPSISGDPALLRRALDNLLENARVYSESDTPVTLSAELAGERLVLSVIDEGVGIAGSDLLKVGTPFFRTDPSRARRTGGLGLGVSLARRIAAAHGGELRLESELGRGTRARLVLPLAAPERRASSPARTRFDTQA